MIFPETLKKSCPSSEHALLKPLTYLRIGGETPLLMEPRKSEEMVCCISLLLKEGLPYRILGGGANVLVNGDGIKEVVVCTRGFSHLYKIDGNPLRLRVEAGVTLGRLISTCRMLGLRGAEALIGIPGTVGGAAVMNAGGRHGSLGALIRRATFLNEKGEIETEEFKPKRFGYRSSPLAGKTVVDVEIGLEKGRPDRIFESMTALLKEKMERQPLMERSCGCIFKNPAGDSAGRMLDAVGMKGRSRGEARVSGRHANFILNRGNATSEDYLALIDEGRQRVYDHFGIELDFEVKIWH
jgi:UDP-N-acetylmuramate dehydrogenase